MRIFDLSHEIYTGMQIYPGDPEVSIEVALSHTKDYCHVNKFVMSSHAGTHIDAPFHFISDGKKISEFNLDKFLGKGVLMDFTDKPDNYLISMSDILEYKQKFVHADIAIIMTGRSKCFGKEKYLNHPYLSKEASELLVNFGVKIVGIDALNIDSSVTEIFDAHQVLLSSEVLIVENLTNLECLKDISNLSKGNFMFIPLRLKNCDGSPIRAFYLE